MEEHSKRPWRMFCAFELPENLRLQLTNHIRSVREAVPRASASWSRPENTHLTLKFFGNVAPEKIPTISAAISRAVREFSPLEICVRGTGVFRKPKQGRVLWIGVEDPSGKLAALQQRVESECESEGFAKEDRDFRPHLTIARIRRPDGANELAETHRYSRFNEVEVRLTELVLFRSEPGSKGSIYTAISRHRLEH